MLVLGAVFAILVLSLMQQSSGPAVTNTRVGMDASIEGVLRTAVGEMREMRVQVSKLQEQVRVLQTHSRGSATGSLSGQPVQPSHEGAVDVHTSSSSAPSSFLDAVAIDDGRQSNFSVLAPVTTTQPDCGMLVFRHIEKTGGTTFRMHMVALHDCGWHVWGYKGTIRLCNKAKAEYEMIKDPSKRPVGRPDGPLLPHLTVESHAEHGDYVKMIDAWVPMVQAWHGTCGIWLISIVREPLKRQVRARAACCRPARREWWRQLPADVRPVQRCSRPACPQRCATHAAVFHCFSCPWSAGNRCAVKPHGETAQPLCLLARGLASAPRSPPFSPTRRAACCLRRNGCGAPALARARR